MFANLYKLFLQASINGLLNFLDRILPPLEPEQPLLKSAAPELAKEETPLVHIGTYPVGSHAEMFISFTPEQPILSVVEPVEPEPITELVITLPPAPNDALEAIAEVLICAPGRTALVEALLCEAWSQGLRTYAQLIKYVELQTGTGCSKKTVSAWKKSRRLIETEEQIAA